LEIIPGGSPDELKSGDTLEFSQDAVDISQLLGKFMFSSAGNDQN
jgi:ABC-type transporter Mla subunit MlaD